MSSLGSYARAALCAQPGRAIASATAVALVVIATSLLAALAGNAERLLVSTADPRNLVVVSAGAASEGTSAIPWPAVNALRALPGVAVGSDGGGLVSAELVVESTLRAKRGGGAVHHASDDAGGAALAAEPIGVVARGVDPEALAFHDRVRLGAGRWPHRGSREVLVGARLAARLGGIRPDHRFEWATRQWTVAGVFAAEGTSYDDEIWVDRSDLASDTGRTGSVSVVRVRARSPAELGALAERIEGDSTLGLDASPELAFYRRQAHGARALRALVALTALLAGTAAAAGLANLLCAAVHSRRREIGVLRALGFSRAWVIGAIEAEAIAVALAGLAIGSAIAAIAAPSLVRSLAAPLALGAIASGSGPRPGLSLGRSELAVAAALALAIGVAAGIAPAWRVARMRPAEVLRAP
jgi:putative ABC transport system permease protein